MSERLDLADPKETAQRVAKILADGGVAVVPSESCYVIIADAFQPMATTRLFGAKRRGRDLPLGVVIRSPRQVNGLVSTVPEAAERLMASYWPGPLTLVFNLSDGLSWDLGDTRGTVALRLPADDLLLEVVAEVGPLAWSAANRTGGDRPMSVEEAELQLGIAVPLYVDGGDVVGADPSTIVDVTRGGAEVLREGALSALAVESVARADVGWGARPPEEDLVEPAPQPAAAPDEPSPPAAED